MCCSSVKRWGPRGLWAMSPHARSPSSLDLSPSPTLPRLRGALAPAPPRALLSCKIRPPMLSPPAPHTEAGAPWGAGVWAAAPHRVTGAAEPDVLPHPVPL